VVRPVIAFVNAIGLEVKQQPADVHICSRRRIAEWLAAQPRTLRPDQVEALFSAGRRSTTWGPRLSVATEGPTDECGTGASAPVPTSDNPDRDVDSSQAGRAPAPWPPQRQSSSSATARRRGRSCEATLGPIPSW
jgi:hypothetical protein